MPSRTTVQDIDNLPVHIKLDLVWLQDKRRFLCTTYVQFQSVILGYLKQNNSLDTFDQLKLQYLDEDSEWISCGSYKEYIEAKACLGNRKNLVFRAMRKLPTQPSVYDRSTEQAKKFYKQSQVVLSDVGEQIHQKTQLLATVGKIYGKDALDEVSDFMQRVEHESKPVVDHVNVVLEQAVSELMNLFTGSTPSSQPQQPQEAQVEDGDLQIIQPSEEQQEQLKLNEIEKERQLREEKQKAMEKLRREEMMARRAAEEAARAKLNAQRMAEERARKLRLEEEEKRRQEEEVRALEEEMARRLAEEKARLAEEARRAEEEKLRQEEEQKKVPQMTETEENLTKMLSSMGFVDIQANLASLRKNKNNIQSTVEELLAELQ